MKVTIHVNDQDYEYELPNSEYITEFLERVDEKLPGGLECAVCDATKEQLLEFSKKLMEQEGWD